MNEYHEPDWSQGLGCLFFALAIAILLNFGAVLNALTGVCR